MKTKLAIVMGVMTAALFLVVPNAESGKKVPPSSVPVSPVCTNAGGTVDHCSLTVTGLSSRLTYKLEVLDDTAGCGIGGTAGVIDAIDPLSAAELAAGINFFVDDGGCGGSTWTFNLYSKTTRIPIVSTLVGSSGPVAIDVD